MFCKMECTILRYNFFINKKQYALFILVWVEIINILECLLHKNDYEFKDIKI